MTPVAAGGTRAERVRAKLTADIETAYNDLAPRPGAMIYLTDLRRRLGFDYSPTQVDNLLRELSKSGRVRLAPDSNRGSLTDNDRRHAIRIGSQDNHLIAVEPMTGS